MENVKNKLIDRHGRHIRKLRLSLLDACNFRCFYCMPEKPKFMPAREWMTVDEIRTLCSDLVALGVEQIRLTGGEPTLRPEFKSIVEVLSELPLKKLAITTNGVRLLELLPFLRETACQSINVSLDSLRPDRFQRVVKADQFQAVIDSIFMAKEMGFKVKVNTVLLKGINDDELSDFVDFSSRYGIEVRFLELMKIGMSCALSEQHFLSARAAIGQIEKHHRLTPVVNEYDSTSFGYLSELGAHIGFIASETRPFCNSCSRLRVTADGKIRPCLMANDGISVRGLDRLELEHELRRVMDLKPYNRLVQTETRMNELGG